MGTWLWRAVVVGALLMAAVGCAGEDASGDGGDRDSAGDASQETIGLDAFLEDLGLDGSRDLLADGGGRDGLGGQDGLQEVLEDAPGGDGGAELAEADTEGPDMGSDLGPEVGQDAGEDVGEDVLEGPPSCVFAPIVVGDPDGDGDGDGFTESSGDCKDDDNAVNPGLPEVFDGKDNNCNGTIDEGFDADCDGFKTAELGGDDCDDQDWQVNPGVEDQGLVDEDSNCDGKYGDASSGDVDGDGFARLGTGGLAADCDDAEAFTYPGAAEKDGPTKCLRDRDNDGYASVAGGQGGGRDCDDLDPEAHPNAWEVPGDGRDQDCAGGDLDPVASAGVFVFVDGTNGLDTNAGTPAAPKKTIYSGLVLAHATDRYLVVAEGDYQEALTLNQGYRIYGGFAAGTWGRDPKAHPTRLLRPEASTFAVKISAASVVLDGLEVDNGVVDAVDNGNQAFTALTVDAKGQLEARQCVFRGGSSTNPSKGYNHTAVQVTWGCTALISESEVHGGSAVYGSTNALQVGQMGYEGDSATLKLHRSKVFGGTASSGARAMSVAWRSQVELVGNFIHGGKTLSGDGWTLEVSSPSSILAVNNTIWGGEATARSAALSNSSQHGNWGAEFIFVNNILEGGKAPHSWGLVTHDETRITLVNNNLHTNGSSGNCQFGRWVGYGQACLTDEDARLNDCSQWAGPENCLRSEGNRTEPPGLVAPDAGDFHLEAGSPLVDAGVDPTWFYPGAAHTLDLDGQWRYGAPPVDQGADERQ